MLIDLRDLLAQAVERVDFSYTLDLSELDFFGERPILPDSRVEGYVENRAGVLALKATVACRLSTDCASCGCAVEKDYVPRIDAVLLPDSEESDLDDALFYSGDSFDMDAAAEDAVVLNMDMRILCREDCKGLCPQCGKNLNEGPCGCSKPIDPRLEKLKALLQKDE